MNVLTDIMIQMLRFFAYFAANNYGIAIILLTVVVNLALYPFTLLSIVQMSAIARIQPKLKELQEKHKGSPENLQKETLNLYKQEKVNPFGGCLPMLIKIPFFLALFFALQSQEFKQIIQAAGSGGTFLWITNLAIPDPTYMMIVLIALTTYYSQKTMPGSQNQQMQSFGYFMPILIAFVSMGFPAGVQLYWVVSSIVAIAQQVYIAKVRLPVV